MADADDEYKEPVVSHLIDNPIISDPDAELVLCSSQLLNAVRTWVLG